MEILLNEENPKPLFNEVIRHMSEFQLSASSSFQMKNDILPSFPEQSFMQTIKQLQGVWL